MASDDVREIKSKLDIVDVVSESVQLKKQGQNYWGCCPFHNEKTPSFCVSPDRQTFHCFGCGKGGDIFSFIMEREHLGFREALERLAEKAGVTLSATHGSSPERRAKTDVNRAALEFFMESLNAPEGEPARKYLERRSISHSDAVRFEIGWAPTSWDSLLRSLKRRGISAEQAVEGGLALVGRSGGCYDRFRGRVMFPIYSITGRVVGFGGRILDGDGAKYMNSPESRVFNKRHNLYLLNKAKPEISSKGSAILVEGYMDAIRAHMCGFTNTVASLGTALTSVQASLIKRMTGLCYVCYDSDSAGEEAALRAMYILQAEGVTAKRAVWSGGKDPDELLLLPEGPELFEKSINEALPLPLYHVRLRSGALKDPERAPEARNDLLDGLASLSVFDVAPYIDELSEALGLFPHEVKALIDARRGGRRTAPERSLQETQAAAPPEPERAETYGDDLEYMICSLLWNDEEMRASCDMSNIALYVSDERVRSVIFAILSGDEPEALERRWQQMNDETGMRIIARGNGLLAREGITRGTAYRLIDELRHKFIKRHIAPLVSKIKDGSITDEEYKEYLRYTRLLKGGSIKA
ncbi:DNA primase [Cloacibacillus sp. An23]|uniref:DNA primase n=1 Tax=Cloacibacillus sp. An23 TaxID=1965591 RepID=UPI000B3A2F72|nr:DNA primase [Cloacibacillus sp. An23]OUO91890.1 DNA primase [Cloacibacillus sp. An23]